MTVSITYRLPISWLVVTGNRRITTDELAPADKKQTASLAGVEFKVVTTGDSTDRTITPPTGTLMTCKCSFGVAPDGRLTSASSDVTGQAGAALKSIASVAGTAAALALLGAAAAPSDDADKQQITDAYGAAYPDQQATLVDLRAARKRLLDDLRRELAAQAADLGAVWRLRTLLAVVDEQLAPVDAHFRAWRASKRTTSDEYFEIRITVDELPQQVAGQGGGTPALNPPTTLQELWERFGMGVRASWPDGAAQAGAVGTNTGTVYTRRPRLLALDFVKQVGNAVVVTDRHWQYVASAASAVVAYQLEKSWLGHRSLSLTFDSDGFVSSVSTEGSSDLAAALAAAESIPTSFTNGLESGTKAYTDVQAARRASLEAELARVKDEVNLRSQQLLAAKDQATAADAVRLARLQQLQQILDAQAKIRGADPALVAELARQAGGELAWYTPPARVELNGPPQTVQGPGQAPALPPKPPPPTGLGHE